MVRRYDKGVSGSVQARNGYLHLVVGYKDPLTQKRKVKWIAMDLPEDSLKSVIEKRKRDMITEFEAKYARLIDGYDNPENYPFVAFMHEWLEEVHRHKIQETTYLGYKERVNGHFAKFFGDKITLADLKPRRINAFYDYLRSIGDNEQRVLHYHNLLHAAFEYAVRQEIFEVNPMNRVERPQAKKFVGEFYSPEELQTLLALTEDESIYIPIVLAAFYGLRRSEALGLSWDHIDFERKEIHICQKVMEIKQKDKSKLVISDEMKTEGSRRTLPLIPDMEEILLRHKKRQEDYQKQFRRGYSVKYLDMVCVDQMGNLLRPNYVTTRFPEVLKKYGLRPIRFHDLRHTCASLLVAKNINMKIIQVWLGHSNMSTTADIYSHLDANAKSEAGRAIESVLSINTESED